ncbi:MAG: 50S ribosomal protein L3 [Nanoarchaeota archaeon]
MPKQHKPRAGSMQFWPRKRAERHVARVRSWAPSDKANLLGFAGYKVGMTHVVAEDTRQKSTTAGEKIVIPVSVIECPSLKIASARFYKNSDSLKLVTEVFAKPAKELGRKIPLPKKASKKLEEVKPGDFDEIRVNVYTQPRYTAIGKKKPDLFEVAIGGSKEDAFAYVKENLGKEISVKEIFSEGELADTHVITKGKGYQGPVKRFGVAIRSSKSEKVKRGPGSIAGGWKAHGHMMYRVPDAGQMGYHMRTEYNKQIISIIDEAEKVNPDGGFLRYGNVKNTFILVKGSVGGPRKRLVRFCKPTRPKKVEPAAPKVLEISKNSKQGK